MGSMSISGVAFACAESAPAYRPRHFVLLTLDPTQRPSAPLRWAA